ncbi:hypothetical protein MTO96_031026 [Rhipicephalus appendiculatus]
MRRIVGKYQTSEEQLIEHIKTIYTGQEQATPPVAREYHRQEKSSLDAPITFPELYAAAQTFKRNPASVPDPVTNAMLHNLSDAALEQLVDFSQ